MTWVVWRQQRAQVLVTLAVLAPVVAVAAFALLDTSFTPAVDEASLKNINPWHQLAMFCAPALLGMFAGAPLFAREIERGTHVFAATQSVGRTRWLATKRAMAGVPLLAAMTVVGVLTAATRLELSTTDYWSFSLMNTPAYETHGPILMGLTGLAFGVGVAAGLLLRNTVTAMVVTIVVYVV
ncbi:MAG: hypothetical protein ACRDXX_13275, partial [Stackebrandtia sp.]